MSNKKKQKRESEKRLNENNERKNEEKRVQKEEKSKRMSMFARKSEVKNVLVVRPKLLIQGYLLFY